MPGPSGAANTLTQTLAPQLTSNNTDGQNVTHTWQTERLARKDCEKLPFVWGIVHERSCICEAQARDTEGGSLSRVVHGEVRKRNIQRPQICEGLSSKKRAGPKLQGSNGGTPLRVKCLYNIIKKMCHSQRARRESAASGEHTLPFVAGIVRAGQPLIREAREQIQTWHQKSLLDSKVL